MTPEATQLRLDEKSLWKDTMLNEAEKRIKTFGDFQVSNVMLLFTISEVESFTLFSKFAPPRLHFQLQRGLILWKGQTQYTLLHVRFIYGNGDLVVDELEGRPFYQNTPHSGMQPSRYVGNIL